MSGLKNLEKRIQYRGGKAQVDRMVKDKSFSLDKALLYSYQSATAVLSDGREFRCLINPNKISMELDDKVLSIPFEDICLNKERPDGQTTSQGKEPIGVKVGDVITWKQNGTHWIIYSQYLQEIAYFRGQMRQCENDALEINGNKYYYYLKGPDEKGIDWQKSKHFMYNDLNYTLEIYISNTTETNEFIQRFQKLKIKGKPFEVQAVDKYSNEGILAIYLKEDFSNDLEDLKQDLDVEPDLSIPRIEGELNVYPYDIKTYNIIGATGGSWLLDSNRAKILSQDETSVIIEIVTGRSGDFILKYIKDNIEKVAQKISILSL